jgi:uncharacterized protein (TIGR03435 family)
MAQTASQTAAQPVFDVASIKAMERPTPRTMMAGQARMGTRIDAGRVEIAYMSLAELVRTAYRLKSYQISGPDWIKTQGFTISATIPEGASREQVPEMLQNLLADRLKLTFHREKKEQPVFALVVGKDGLKLKEVEPDPKPADDPNGGARPPMQFRTGGGSGGPPSDGLLHFDRKMTLAQLADFLTPYVDRPVMDMTDSKATYQVAIGIPMAAMFQSGRANIVVNGQPGGQGSEGMQSLVDQLTDEAGGVTVFTAVQKLGLKLEPRKASIDFVVVDHAEKSPTEN